MTSRIDDPIAKLGAIDEAAAERVAHAARERIGSLPQGLVVRRRLPAPRLALAAGLALAIAAALVVAIRPWGGDDASAGLLRRVSLVVTPPPHTIEHIVTVLHQGSLELTTESWQSIDDPFTLRWRQIASTTCGGSWTTEFSSTLSQKQWFDSDHDRVLRIPLNPVKERASAPAGGNRMQFDATVSFAFALRNGQAHVAGSRTLNGEPVTQITWPSQDPNDPASRNILYVATATGVPVAYQWGGGKLDATGGIVAQQSFPTYEFLPESPATARALSVLASHPDAALPPVTTEKEMSARYQDAQRLHCGGVG